MSDELQIISGVTDADLEGILHNAIRNTLIFGVLASLVVWKASSWRDAAMLATGAAISAASLFEWRRLARFIAAKMEKKQTPRGSAFAVVFFLLRLTIFAGVIYVSLKCFRGSAIALLCGLALAVLTLVWEALRLLRN
ncbi:MAG: hypothetical protein ABSD59_08290 [Terracidiphilus sp.]|jgi:hypothetical protein